jgi:hypothetical protein
LARKVTQKVPKSNLEVEVTLTKGPLRIAARGTISKLAGEIGSISKFAEFADSKLGRQVKGYSTYGESSIESEETSIEAPVIKVAKSTIENLRTLFDTPWGRTPRSVEDSSKALELNAAPDSPSNVAVALMRLVKKGELRRIRKTGKWHYFRIPS